MQVIGYVIAFDKEFFLDFGRGYDVDVCFNRPYKTKLRPYIFGDESSAKNVAKNAEESNFARIFSWGKLTVKPVYVG